jgi:Tat protein secretion system quality control protein TatD with DNase activity
MKNMGRSKRDFYQSGQTEKICRTKGKIFSFYFYIKKYIAKGILLHCFSGYWETILDCIIWNKNICVLTSTCFEVSFGRP